VFRRSRPAAEDPSSYDGAEDAGAAIPGDDGVARSPAITAGKGRPTPKRSDAERRRRQPYTAPKDRKEAGRAVRDRQRADRGRRMEAVRRGEEWALPARDRGPVKALARDYVDSKRRLSEFYMYGLIAILLLSLGGGVIFGHAAHVQSVLDGVIIVGVLIMLAEGVFLGRKVRALAAERLPGVSTRGVALYSAMRALQIRKLRMPRPRVNIGDKV
jgi:DUF3043 family protein